jgi:hypothetical protein
LKVRESGDLEVSAAQHVLLAAFVDVRLEFHVRLELEPGVVLGDAAEVVGRRKVEVDGQR